MISGCLICGRLARFKTNVRRVIVRIWITHVCSHILDVQAGNRSFLLQRRARNYFARRRFAYGWIASSSMWRMCLGNILQWASRVKPWASHKRKSYSASSTFWHLWCLSQLTTCTTQHSQPFTLNPTLILRRHCGSDPNDQQRTKPEPKRRHKNAQSRFELVVWEVEWIWIFLFWSNTCEQQINWRIFWQREYSWQCSEIHYWLCGKSDEPSNQMMSADFLENLSLVQLYESSKRCVGTLTRYGVDTRQKYWTQVALWIFTWPWNNWAIVSLFVRTTRGIFLS